MPERGEFDLPESEEIIQGISERLRINPHKEPPRGIDPFDDPIFPEEARTPDSRFVADACLTQISHITLNHTPEGGPILLKPGDARWLYTNFHEIVEDAWDLPEPFPNFTLENVLGAAKRQIALLMELARFEETSRYNGALAFMGDLHDVLGQAVIEEKLRDNQGG